MVVTIGPDGQVALESADDFNRFHVELRGATPEAAGRSLQSAGVGRVESATQAFITVSGLEKLAGERASDAAWRANLEKMLAYAKKKGWWDEAAQAIAAHVENR